MNYSPNSLMGYKLFNNSLDAIPGTSKTIINTINQYSFCIAERDSDFKTALMASDVLLADGIGVVVALKSLTGYNLEKTSGADLHQSLLKRLNRSGGRVFYLGSSPRTLSKIKQRIESEYPNITCDTYSPPFKAVFTDDDNAKMVAAVNGFKPDALFVGMTAPKQEKWVQQHKTDLDAKFICSIGAVFDFYAGTVKRPSQFWIDLGLEWFVRLCREPKRMWRRYIYYGPVFIYALLKEKITADTARRPVMAYSEQVNNNRIF